MGSPKAARREVANEFFGDQIAAKLMFYFRLSRVFYGLAFYGFLSLGALFVATRLLHWHLIAGAAYVWIYGMVFAALLFLTVWGMIAGARARSAIQDRFGPDASPVQVRTMVKPDAFRTWCLEHGYASIH